MPKQGWLAEFVEKVVCDYLEELGLQRKSSLGEHVYSYTILWVADTRKENGKKFVPSSEEIKTHILSVLRDLYEFYKDMRAYAEKIAQREFQRMWGLSYGQFMHRILDEGEEYKLIFYTSLCEDPEIFHDVAVWKPKVSERELAIIKNLFS